MPTRPLRANPVRLFDLSVTALRWYGARFRARKLDTAPLAAHRATGPEDVFYIVGPGGTLNDLNAADRDRINNGTSASVNMAVLAPFDFRICSVEAILNQRDEFAIAAALRKKTRPPLIWFQNRAKYDSEHIRAVEREFPFYRYCRASVSVRGNLRTFYYILHHFMRKRLIEQPDLSVCFAMCGSIARLVMLALSLGYRRICFAGVDLGSTQYYWLEENPALDPSGADQISDIYKVMSKGALSQGGAEMAPNFFQFVEAIARECPEVRFSTLDPRQRSRLTQYLQDNGLNSGQT